MSRLAIVHWTRAALAFIGVILAGGPLTAQAPGRLGLQFEYLQEFVMGERQAPRTLISAVLQGGAAQRAGLLPGDVVQEINGMAPSHALIMHLGPELKSGDSVRILVTRQGEQVDRWVVADRRPEGEPPAGTLLGLRQQEESGPRWPEELLAARPDAPRGVMIVLNEADEGRSFRYSFRSTNQGDLPFEAFVVRTPQTDSLMGLIQRVQSELRTAPNRIDDADRLTVRRAELVAELDDLHRELAAVSRERLRVGNLGPQMAEVRVRVSQPGIALAPMMHTNRAYFLGAEVTSVNGELGRYFGVDDGVLISSVPGGTPAEQAGLRAGDVIVSTNRGPVRDFAQLRGYLYRWTRIELTVVRDGEEMTLQVPSTR